LKINNLILGDFMGLRGPNSMAWRLRQQRPAASPSRASLAAARQEAALDRLQRLAHGTGLTIVSYQRGRFAIVGKLERIEAMIEQERC
jgi:hypothetical protein